MLVVSGCFNGMLTDIAVLKAKAIYDERTVALHIFKRTVICNCCDMKYTGPVQIQTSWIYMNLSYDGLSQERNHTSSFTQGKFNSLNKIAHVTHVHSETTQAIMISPRSSIFPRMAPPTASWFPCILLNVGDFPHHSRLKKVLPLHLQSFLRQWCQDVAPYIVGPHGWQQVGFLVDA